MGRKLCFYSCCLFLTFVFPSYGTAGNRSGLWQEPEPPISVGQDGYLQYTSDEQGNRIPDFSYCGYMAGEKPIPEVPVRVVVPLTEEDATFRIQAALNYVASLPLDSQGIRGAVLLEKGLYKVKGQLQINASGIVLRGSGMDEEGTVLLADGLDRRTLISIAGKDDRQTGPAIAIQEAYVPVNAKKFRVAHANALKPGDQVFVHRPSTQDWIHALDMEEFGGETEWLGWKPGERDLYWDRKIIAVDGNTLTLDAPLTSALDTAYGGGNITPYQWPGRIAQLGVENLRCRSTYDQNNPKDEDHSWMAITLENVTDAWVRQVVFEHFASSAVAVMETGRRITVEDCLSLAPVSEIGGQRRYTFWTLGQQTLFQRLYAEYGYHDFAAGFRASLNAFVQCKSYLPYSFSGTIDSWASGILFDIVEVDGQALRFSNRRQEAQGAGWTAANSMFWQCSAAHMDCFRPPTAQNWAFGAWAEFSGDGYWYEANSHIKPYSLYYAQLRDRLGDTVLKRAQLLEIETSATSSPTLEQAAELTALSNEPAPLLKDWINQAAQRNPIPVSIKGVKTIDQIGYDLPTAQKARQAVPIQIVQGWLILKDRVLTGKRQDVPWWRGDVHYYATKKARPHITRFVPGRTGWGLTDHLEAVADTLVHQQVVSLEHNYGLWYDRRRDDHERVRRMSGEVWAPFYELPFARSGQGTAWDGLSKYDLTKYNPWYWGRLQRFADLADQKGLVLIHQHYFQHNILEAGAHWADFPWRTANNINDTGFPEPPPYAGDKRIFMAEQFYDITHPARRRLHEAYIRKCLDNFANHHNVIQFIGAEYTGPLHFVQFWIDTILAWEKETGKDAVVGLSVTKEVQDAILADPVRASAVDLIDIRYWHYREDGSLYAPAGGQQLAPRQHARLVAPGKSSLEQVYRAVQAYRQRYPDKAVTYTAEGYDSFAWATFMAGGSMASLPVLEHPEFLADAATMHPSISTDHAAGSWVLSNENKEYIIYSDSTEPMRVDLTQAVGTYCLRWLDPDNGRLISKEENVEGGTEITRHSPQGGPAVMWVTKQ